MYPFLVEHNNCTVKHLFYTFAAHNYFMNPKRLITLLLLFFQALICKNIEAQKTWTLKECIDYALKNNISVKQASLSTQLAKSNYLQSMGSLFPSLNGSSGLNYNYGRSLDPTSYQYTNETFQSGNVSLNSNLTLFNGLEQQNTLRKNKIDVVASKWDEAKMQNDIALAVATGYLQVLYSNEQLKAAQDRLEAAAKQRERTKLLVDNELLARGSLLDAEAFLAGEELNKVSADNLVRTSKLNLIQLMQLDSLNDISIESPALEVPADNSLAITPENIFNSAISTLPEIKSADLKIMSAQKSIAIARGGRYPRLSMFGSLSSNFTNQAKTDNGVNPTLIGYIPNQSITTAGDAVLSPIYDYSKSYDDTPINDQLNDNFGKSFGISLSIPIFNGFAVHSSISRAKINFESAKLNAQQTKNTVYKNVQQAHADALAAFNRLTAQKKNADALRESFVYTEKKFNAGLVNSLEYITSRNNMTKAESDLLQSKYDYILKLKVIDFYLGKPLSF